MKKLLFFLLFSIIITGQKVETINLNKYITDPRGSYKSFNVLDGRSDKEIGSLVYDNEPVSINFKNDATSDIKTWFYKKNELKGKEDLILLLEKIKVSEEKGEKYSEGRLAFRASTFLKKKDGYHFIYRKDTVITMSSKNNNIARSFSSRINEGLADLLRSTYGFSEWNQAIPENELNNYENLIKSNLELLQNNNFKEGVYRDFYSFFMQNPAPGFTVEINKRGVVTKAINGKEKISVNEIYAYVLDGKAYKYTPVGFTEVSKDSQGYYINSSRANLFPANNSNGAMIGGMTGGLVGGLIGAAIDAGTSKKNNGNSMGEKVHLDPLTGNYIFPEN